MTDFTLARQRAGVGRYAFCGVHSFPTNEVASFISDRCTWQRVNQTYKDVVIHSGFLDWKQSVINGMQHALSRITFASNIEIELLDVDGHIAHSDSTTMFIAGFLSVFKELQINLSVQDLRSIDDLFRTPSEIFGIIAHIPIAFSSYAFPEIS